MKQRVTVLPPLCNLSLTVKGQAFNLSRRTEDYFRVAPPFRALRLVEKFGPKVPPFFRGRWKGKGHFLKTVLGQHLQP